MFGQKSREREMYISEHVAHIRHRPTTVGCGVHIQAFARLYVSFFLFSTTMGSERVYTKQHAKGQSSAQLVRWFIYIVVLNIYCRLLPPKIRCSLSYFFLLIIFQSISKKADKKINLVNFTKIHIFEKKKIQIKYWFIAW